MKTIKKQYSTKELAELKLDCLPATKVGIANLADREGWAYADVTGRGGKRRELLGRHHAIGVATPVH